MIIKINNQPIEIEVNVSSIPEAAYAALDTVKEMAHRIQEPFVFSFNNNGEHLASLDINPFNVPLHLKDGIVQFLDGVSNLF